MACHRAGSRAHTETPVQPTPRHPCLCRAAPGPPAWPELPTELLLLGPAGTIPVPPAAAPAKGKGTAMGTRCAGAGPEPWRGDGDPRHGHSCSAAGAEPRRAESCRAGCPPRASRAHRVQLRSSPPRLPFAAPPCVSAVPMAGAAAGGDRGTLVLCHRGAPPAPRLNVALVPHRPWVSPVNVCSGARLSPAGGRGQAGRHISRACHPPALEPPAPSPAPGIGTPKRHHPPPPGLPLPMATSPGTRAGDTVTLPGYFGEDKSGRRQVRGRGSRR